MFFPTLLAFVSLASLVLVEGAPSSRSRLAHEASTFQRRVLGADDIKSVSSSAPSPFRSVVSVDDFGAKGDGVTDNTAAFQAAFSAVSNGGIVFVPAGNWSFDSSLYLPKGVSLVGTFTTVPSHNIGQTGGILTNGSLLFPRGGRGNASAPAFLNMVEDSSVRGFTFFYPEVDPTLYPVPYPYTISMVGNNIAIQDVELLNSFNGISAVGAHRHYIARVQGQPVAVGIFVDQTYDIGRLEDIHWNPWFSTHPDYIKYQTTEGRGFLIARTDWEYVLNTFVFSMAIGYQFIESKDGACNGNFVGLGADCCANASVQVDAADPWGIAIVNGEFTSFSGGFGPDVADHTQVVVSASNVGAVRFVSSAFWGPSHQIARINGTGSVGFESCLFNTWAQGANLTGDPAAIQAFGGKVFVRGGEFQSPHKGGQVFLGAGVEKAIISENMAVGPWLVTDENPGGKRVVKDNLGDD